MVIPQKIKTLLKSLPAKPGCYLMKDADGRVIYVGKAVNLRNRVRSYFHNSAQEFIKTRSLVARIADFEWIMVGSELEALILEMNLIKKHRPRYNIRLKDDKQYPYIKIHWNHPFPKVSVTRLLKQDGSRYFGPYTGVWAVHQTLDVLRRVFPYITCDRTITGEDKRSCLYQDIKLCLAPCVGVVNQSTYRLMIADLCKFLGGRTEPILSRLKLDMQKASDQMQFEQAAILRDQVQAIEKIVEHQRVVTTDFLDSDVIAMARANDEACVQVFFIRAGKLIGSEHFFLEGTQDTPDSKVFAEFIKQFYDQSPNIPSQVLLPNEVEEASIIKQWLRTRKGGKKVEILVPRRGKKKDLIKMASENASETISQLKTQWENDRKNQTQATVELKEALHLPVLPNRIECYDISNTQGTSAVGSMTVFIDGAPCNKLYRLFNIRTVQGPDDYASMEEVLLRRFKRWNTSEDQQDIPGKKPDAAFNVLPDLLIVDGGKGQLSRAVSVLKHFNLFNTVQVVGLAKGEEEIFLPGQPIPILLPRKSQGLYLIQRIRDEAHRFAITSHRKKRVKTNLISSLDSIPGIGPKRRQALLKHFKTMRNIRDAGFEEICKVNGISMNLARIIDQYLHDLEL